MKKFISIILALALVLSVPVTAAAADTPEFEYDLQLTDQYGMTVENPRSLNNGDTLHVAIILERSDVSGAHDIYGIEFRLLTIGLEYNNDGKTLRSGTEVRAAEYLEGDSVGFAWYDMQQIGESINDPVLAASWSYTVTDASIVNIRVPVTLVYVPGHESEIIPIGEADLYLDTSGGNLDGDDVSGTYPSGTEITLPGMVMGDWVFAGWSDGVTVYPAGSKFVVSGVLTLTPVWVELERNRYITFEPNGGTIAGKDPSGYYADGEIIIMPYAQREGYDFLGWDDGTASYGANEKYVVSDTVIMTARWEIAAPTTDKDFTLPDWLLPMIFVLLGLLLIILLLWKRCFVRYSLKTGDVALSYKNNRHNVQVEAVLYSNGKKYSLNKSERVEAKHRLRFIKNINNAAVAEIEPGNYKGILIITDGGYFKTKKCRIKVLESELKDKSGS